MSDPKPFFIEGRRCPDDKFRASVVWRLRAIELETFAKSVEALDRDDPGIASLFGISNAEREQERGAAYTPGPCQAQHLARLKDVDHEPREALDGLIAAGIEDLSRAHATQLRAGKRQPTPRRSERRTQEASRSPLAPEAAQEAKAPSRHPRAIRVRPLAHSRTQDAKGVRAGGKSPLAA